MTSLDAPERSTLLSGEEQVSSPLTSSATLNSDTSRTEASAVSHVLAVPELFDQILTFLPTLDALFRARHISRLFRDAAEFSRLWRTRVLAAVHKPYGDAVVHDTGIRIKGFRAWANLVHNCWLELRVTWEVHRLDYRRLEACELLRGLQLARPGLRKCRVVYRCVCDDGVEVAVVVEDEGGVTFGRVFGEIALKRTCGCRSIGRIWVRGGWLAN